MKKRVIVSSFCAMIALMLFVFLNTNKVEAAVDKDPTWTHIFNGEDFPCYRVPSNCLMDWPS